MNSCDFCKKIYDYDTLMYLNHWDRDICVCITFIKDDNAYYLWAECEDDYYSDNITEINYCPKCGRKLNN